MFRSAILCLIFKIYLITQHSLSAPVPLPRNFDIPGPCDPNNCKLPECFCSGIEIPLGLNREEIPQMVLLTFDDALLSTNFEDFDELFSNRYNPNGAAVSATYFVSHDYSDYYLIRKLYEKGHEIALHSITHEMTGLPSNGQNETLWRQEIEDHVKLMSHFAKIPPKDIKGFRAPFLQMGGDAMFKVLMESGLEYDYSRTTSNEYMWPYTADYESTQECSFPPCHTKSYPGMWIVPTANFRSRTGLPCEMVDACNPVPQDAEETFQLLWENFIGHYNGNRAPMAVPIHSAWLTHSGHKEGYRRFLDYLGSFPDVYIVGISQALDWIKSPVTVNRVRELDSWSRNMRGSKGVRSSEIDNCSQMYKCFYEIGETPLDFEHSFVSCQPCPPRYPWLGNPFGNSLTSQEKSTDDKPIIDTEIILPPVADIIAGEAPTARPRDRPTVTTQKPFSIAATTIRPRKTIPPIPILVEEAAAHTIKTEFTNIKRNQLTAVKQPLEKTVISTKVQVQETTTEALRIQTKAPKIQPGIASEILPTVPTRPVTLTETFAHIETAPPARIPIEIGISTSTEKIIEIEDISPQWDEWVEDNRNDINSGQWVDDTSLWKYDEKQSLGDYGIWDEGPGQWVDDTGKYE